MLLEKRIPVAYILDKIRYDLIYVLIVSLVVLLITDLLRPYIPEMPLTIPVFLGTAISILLSFKLNQSYDRWWEARKIWGSIVNDSRSLTIQLTSMVKPGNEALIKKMALRQVAWCYALGQTLRNLDPMSDMAKYLNRNDMEELQRHQNKCLGLLQMNARDINELKRNNEIDGYAFLQLDNTLVRLTDAQGRAERIKSTVFPSTYRRFLHFIIYLFVVTLSIALNVTGIFEIPLLILISVSFFLLEKSATHMQDPFENRPTDTAMTSIANKIEVNIMNLLNEQATERKMNDSTFYIM